MLIECAHCGAPLDVRQGVHLARCRYCGTSSAVTAMRTIAPHTPPDYRPPRAWTPPAHVPADSAVTLQYQGGGSAAGLIVGLVLLAGGLIALAVLFLTRSPVRHGGAPGAEAEGGHTVAELAPLTMRESKAELAKRFGVSAKDEYLRVPLKGSPFSAVTFEFGDDTSHVRQFYFNYSGVLQGHAQMRKKLEARLPARWSANDSWRWEDVSLYLPSDGGVFHVHVETKHDGQSANPSWRIQAETLWSVVKVTVLGLDGQIDEKAVRDYLGGGAPLTELPKILFEVDVDSSRAAVAAVFPGVTVSQSSDMRFTVALDHPYLEQAQLTWPNKKGGKLTEILLRPRAGNDFAAGQQDTLIECMRTAFGIKGSTYESDYLKKQKDVSFALPQGGHVRIYYHLVTIAFRDYPWAGPMKKDTWDKLAPVLDACGRPAK